VPILIAIGVLAALSIGAVVARRRRQRRGLGDPISKAT
jgi:LPXTG-motif cell wall-anchored protein